MDELKDLYERIALLRKKGMKMKELAGKAGIPPSVLSAFYSTVLPAYLKNREAGEGEEESVQNALTWVTNVSRKKLPDLLARLKTALVNEEEIMPPPTAETPAGIPFLAELEHNMLHTVRRIAPYAGCYLSYSVSSNSQAMKIEPYLIAPSVDGGYVEVVHSSAYGNMHHGVACMNEQSHLYLMFNECRPPQLALFHICLKLPLYDRPPFLRGVYTCFDYNYNPIARRILFVKVSDETDRKEFLRCKGMLKTFEELEGEEKVYYDYTCGKEDRVRICNIPSPQMTPEDLVMEKNILSLEK